jgi:hypothetical protein
MRCANTRTTWDEKRICWELLAHRQGIHTRKGIPPGIASLFTQNSLKILRMVTIPGSGDSNFIY